MCRIFDGTEEVISAEYLPMVLQFGLSEEYDRQQITPDSVFIFWPEENLALQVTVESLIRPRFQRWLRDTLCNAKNRNVNGLFLNLLRRMFVNISAGYSRWCV
jgi:hypothetical protein